MISKNERPHSLAGPFKDQSTREHDNSSRPLRQEFDGPEFNQRLDGDRLGRQHEKIRDLMLDGRWRTLGEIAEITGYPESSISAQLRHLRKPRFGSYDVIKRRRAEDRTGIFEYRVEPPLASAQLELIG